MFRWWWRSSKPAGSGRYGWPVTIWFESKEAAQAAAEAIGPIIAEQDQYATDARPDIVYTFGKPSLALEVGLKETEIPLNRKTAWDR